MSFKTKAKDWHVACVAQVGGGKGAAGGTFLFTFYSKEAKIKESFNFTGGGIGVGGSANGGSLTPHLGTLIKCEKAFSIEDLHRSGGRITVGSASFVIGYSLLWISGFNTEGALFTSQYIPGWGIGVGAGALTLLGSWNSGKLSAAHASQNVNKYIQSK